MRRASRWAMGVALIGSAAGSAYAEPNFKEGMWEITMQMQMANMPMQMPPVTVRHCLLKKDVVPNTARPGQDCHVVSHRVSGDTVEWSMRCTDKSGRTMDGKGQVTYSGESYAGTMNMTMSGSRGDEPATAMSYTMSGRRVGECPK